MNIAVFGLGYVGCVTAACLARAGHSVVGVDVQREKVDMITQGLSPIVEPGLNELVRSMVQDERLRATCDPKIAVEYADLAIVCVGTPSDRNGNLDLQYVERVCHDIGQAMRTKQDYFVVAIRSTMLPGKAETVLLPILATSSGRHPGDDFGFCVNPEFLREGSAIADFDHPPFTVIGELDTRSGDSVVALYQELDTPIFRVELGEAEMVKYSSNAFHALKIVFANEIGNLCQQMGLDSHRVLDVFTQDTKLNLSSAYLKPGFAFGGSCLGKDMRALLYTARQNDLRLPVLESVLPSNLQQIEKALDLLVHLDDRSVAMIGLSFKPNTDDLRESPAVELAERLIGKGFELHIYDRSVTLSRLHGSNQAFIDRAIPHLASLIVPDLRLALKSATSVVITKQLTAEERELLRSAITPEHTIIDLVRIDDAVRQEFQGSYHGICW